MGHRPERLHRFPLLPIRLAVRDGGRRPCCGAASSAGRPRDGATPVSQARGSRGFTLVELLLAIAVMGLLAILSWRGLDGMVRAQEITRQRADEMLVLQAALGQWGADLDALLPIANTTPLDWDGQVLRLTRRSSNPQIDEGAWVVAWSRRLVGGQNQWTRWQSTPLRTRGQWTDAWMQAAQWGRSTSSNRQAGETPLFPLAQWRLYYYRDNAWSNPQSSDQSSRAATSADGAQLPNLPDGIRLELTLPPGGAVSGPLTIDWANPLRANSRS